MSGGTIAVAVWGREGRNPCQRFQSEGVQHAGRVQRIGWSIRRSLSAVWSWQDNSLADFGEPRRVAGSVWVAWVYADAGTDEARGHTRRDYVTVYGTTPGE
jgi:hypothetical protein